jgi:aromatic-L-amino-acid decarboxylase
MVIRSYGVEGLASVIREHIRLAADLARAIEKEPDFELLAKPMFSTVVFRCTRGSGPEDVNDRNRRIVEAVNGTHETFISHTTVRGRNAIRIAIGNLRTAPDNVGKAWELVRKTAAEL